MKQEIVSKNAPAAVGAYSQGIRNDGLVLTSGQLPICSETNTMPTDIEGQTEQALMNIENVLEEAGCGMKDVLKSTVLLTDINDFAAVNKVYEKHFSKPYPARSCFAVKALPKDAKIEIEVIAKE